MSPHRYLLTAVCCVGLSLPIGTAPTAAGSAQGTDSAVLTGPCLDSSVSLPYEESYLEKPQAAAFIRVGGFKPTAQRFAADLCRTSSASSAQRLIERSSTKLWTTAVARAQGKVTMGTLSAGDDRPLYWTRLAMIAALRQWQPNHEVKPEVRQNLIDTLDRVSRGQNDIRFSAGTMKRVLVTGFDPFTLHADVRQGNPSGASALALDGQVIQTEAGPARVEAAVFPVRWRDFEQGMVERTLLPHFQAGPKQVDAFATTSQGRPNQFDLEAFNGAWRGGFGDNEAACYRGMAPMAAGLPTVKPQPQWVPATLPMEQMRAADTGSFKVIHNTKVVEVAPDTPPEPVTTTCPAASSPGTPRPDGPTPGSQARSGGGGNYLSNEIAYRATLLRDLVGLKVPGGHIHTPVLSGLSSNQDELSTPTFEKNRQAINDQVRNLVRVEVNSVDRVR